MWSNEQSGNNPLQLCGKAFVDAHIDYLLELMLWWHNVGGQIQLVGSSQECAFVLRAAERGRRAGRLQYAIVTTFHTIKGTNDVPLRRLVIWNPKQTFSSGSSYFMGPSPTCWLYFGTALARLSEIVRC